MDSTEQSNRTAVSETKEQTKEQDVTLLDIEITNENMALNVIVSFMSMAQKRGAFSLQESAKIWECIQMFGNKK